MAKPEEIINQFFVDLGFSAEETRLYWELVRAGALTTLQLSRKTKISRTQIYRLLEKMKARGVVEEVIDEYRLLARAVRPDSLDKLIKDQEEKTKKLRQSFPQIQELLSGQTGFQQPGTEVKFYRGKQGLQQMVWNNLQAKGEILGYTYLSFDSAVGKVFVRQFYEEMFKRQINLRDIYCDTYLENINFQLERDGYKVELPQYPVFNQSRYLPDEVLRIDHQLDVYNDVIAAYNWHEGEVFGVEIHNPKVASLQKQLFELAWQQGIPEEKLIKKGKIIEEKQQRYSLWQKHKQRLS